MCFWRNFGFIFCLAIITSGGAWAADEVVASVNSEPIQRSFFGIHAHRLDVGTAWPSSEVGAFRTWDAKVRWADLQPTPSTWNFSRLDYLVNGAAKRNIDVLVPLGMPAAWASARPQEVSAYGLGQAAPPARLTDWEIYVQTVVTRYKGRVAAYEIWNEPNLPRFFSGSPQELVELTCAAQRIIKKLDPTVTLVSPAALGDYGVIWLDKFLAAGGGKCIDVLGYHFYNKHKDPETHIAIFKAIREVERKYLSVSKPIWSTEAGWLIESVQQKINTEVAGFDKSARILSRKEAPALVARTLILHAALGTKRFYWYALDNEAMGLFEQNGAPKPAWLSYTQMAKLLTRKVVSGCQSNKGIWTCSIEDEGKTIAVVMWITTQKDAKWTPPSNAISAEIFGQGAASLEDALAAGLSGNVVTYRLP